jgi:hypothetical protein
MLIPDEFNRLCAWFHQDAWTHFETTEQVIADAVSHLSDNQRKVVRAYLDELLSGKHTEEELQHIWRATSAGIAISSGREGDSARFLLIVRAAIGD